MSQSEAFGKLLLDPAEWGSAADADGGQGGAWSVRPDDLAGSDPAGPAGFKAAGLQAGDAAESPAPPPAGAEALGGDDAITSLAALANDIGYTNGSLWGMYGNATAVANVYGTQAGEAWDLGITGTMKTVVGVVDTGVDYTHPDLYLNIWLNQGEIPIAFKSKLQDTDGDGLITFRDLNDSRNAAFVTDINKTGYIDAGDLLNDSRWENGIDEDGNGYRDDLIGWDFYNNDNDPMDDNRHGTHVSGTIGAMGGNEIGVAGVNWNVQIVALKYAAASGSGLTSKAAMALDYFTNASKANPNENFVATNNSWSTSTYSMTLQGAIDRAAQAGILTVASSGNNARDNDATPIYPSSYSTVAAAGYEAVISVGSISSDGGLSWFSNWGRNTVDIAAPGENILSTLPGGGYGALSGTSMAAPHVTGALALYASAHPDATAAQIRQALLDSATSTASLVGKVASNGRLDLDAMLDLDQLRIPPKPEIPQAVPNDPTPSDPIPTSPPPAAAMLIYGTEPSDTLIGDSGNDTLIGVPDSSTRLGRNTIDELWGKEGVDLFVLGDARGAFHNDGNADSAGLNNYARIMDFEAGEKIQVAGSPADYFFRANFTRDGVTGTAIFLDTNSSGAYERTDEMIGLVVGDMKIGLTDLIFVTGSLKQQQSGSGAEPTPGQFILGTTGSDTLAGGDGPDTLCGVPLTGNRLGHGTVDVLTGGAGADLFVLGDARGAFYNDGNADSAGMGHYALIADFEAGDKLQVAGSAGDYFFRTNFTRDGVTGTGIFLDTNGSGDYDRTDEMIALVAGSPPLSQSDLVFV